MTIALDTSRDAAPKKSPLEQTQAALAQARDGDPARANFVQFMLEEVGARQGITHEALGTNKEELNALIKSAQDRAKEEAILDAKNNRIILEDKDTVPAARIEAHKALQEHLSSGQLSLSDILFPKENEELAKDAINVGLRRAHIQAAIDLQDSIPGPGGAGITEPAPVAAARKEYAEHLRQARSVALSIYSGGVGREAEEARNSDPEGHAERHVEELKILKDGGSGATMAWARVQEYAEINKIDGWKIFATTQEKQAGITGDDVHDKIEALYEKARKANVGSSLTEAGASELRVARSHGGLSA